MKAKGPLRWESLCKVPRLLFGYGGDYVLGENQNIFDSYYQMVGNCISLANIPIGTWVHVR